MFAPEKDFVVEVWIGGQAGIPNFSDFIPSFDELPGTNVNFI